MDTSIFEELGFSNAETKIYLAILKLGNTNAGPIIKETGLQNSVVHLTLQKLVEKGIISFIRKGKIKQYRAIGPESIIKLMEERKKRFEALIPELRVLQQRIEKQEAEIFQGFKGFKAMLYEFIKDAKSKDEYLFFTFYTKDPDDFDNVYNFYKKFEKERNSLGLIVKGIAPNIIKDKFKGRNMKNVLFVNFPIPTNISILNNKVILTPWEDEQISFLIHSRQLAECFRQYFYSIWNKYKR